MFYRSLVFLNLFCSVGLTATSVWAGFIANPLPELAQEIEKEDLRGLALATLGVNHSFFCGPNEIYPRRMLNVTEGSTSGVYLGVGTERCLMTALLNQQVQFLIQADHDPRVIFYNQINWALIRLADHREDYLHLRLQATQEEWLSRGRNKADFDPEDLRVLSSENALQFWTSAVRVRVNPTESKIDIGHWSLDMLRFQTDPRSQSHARARAEHAKGYYEGANYLFDDGLFQRLQKFALNGQVQVTRMNLSDSQQMSKIVDVIQDHEMKLSIFDCSNAWQCNYRIEADRLHDVVRQLDPISDSESIFLGTAWARFEDRWVKAHEFYFDQHAVEWSEAPEDNLFLETGFAYFSARISKLQKMSDWKRFQAMYQGWERHDEAGKLLASEVERKDAHFLEDWRLPERRQQYESFRPQGVHVGWQKKKQVSSQTAHLPMASKAMPSKGLTLLPRVLRRK